MPYQATLTLRSLEEGLQFEGAVDGLTMSLDSGPGQTAINPAQLLLVALGGCSAMDVIGILRKKRLAVTSYQVVVNADRRDEHPRVFTRIELVHRVRGRGIPFAAVEEAARLSDTKYCTVHAMLEPAVKITTRIEIDPE